MKSETANPKPKIGAKGFSLLVSPKQEVLNTAISKGAHCDPRSCWHYLEVAAILHAWDPDGNHHVRVDAGHVKFNLWGWRYVADTPRTVKRGLMLFDVERYNEIRIRPYKLRCKRMSKILPYSAERREQIYAARQARIEAGKPDAKYQSLRKRVEGFSSIV
jgi:hypothetical protein